uniref:TAP binding protein like n=1 Tax=Oncorhynchus tshawytscha TaxID=74940 RepID=A0A8C8BTX5_ONCTS
MLLFGYLITCVSGQGRADVVLSCSLVEEGSGVEEMGGGALFSLTSAKLVLRDLAVTPDLSPDSLTPFKPPAVQDPDNIILEAKVESPEIPEADLLLHADCNEQEVTCEISRYFLHKAKEVSTEPAYFIGSLQMEGGVLSLKLVLQTLPLDQSDRPALIQSKLELPLSQSGTLLTEVFLVFSRSESHSAPLGGAPPPGQELGLEWQHRGSGRKMLEIRAGQTEAEEGPAGERLVIAGGAISGSSVYVMCDIVCTLFTSKYEVSLSSEPPHVSLSEEKLVFRDELPQKLSCHCKNYYPLDVQMEWFSVSLTDSEPNSYWMVLGFLVITVLFFYHVMK